MTTQEVEVSVSCQFCAEDGVSRVSDTSILVDEQRVPLCDDCADHTYLSVPLDWAVE